MMDGAPLRKRFFANAQNDTNGTYFVILNAVKNLHQHDLDCHCQRMFQ